MQKQWLEHFCKYRHICEFLGSEGKEKEEIKEYLMQELGLPEAIACYQMTRALADEDGIVKSLGWKFYLDEEKFKAVIEDLRSIYPIRLKPYPYPPQEETEARDGLIEIKKKYLTGYFTVIKLNCYINNSMVKFSKISKYQQFKGEKLWGNLIQKN